MDKFGVFIAMTKSPLLAHVPVLQSRNCVHPAKITYLMLQHLFTAVLLSITEKTLSWKKKAAKAAM